MLEIFDSKGNMANTGLKDLSDSGSSFWIDCTNISKEESNGLKEIFNLHPLTAEDLYNSPIRVKVEEFDNYLLCVFYGMQSEKKKDLIEIDFIIGKNFLITNHKKKIGSFESIKKDSERLKRLFDKGFDFLFHKLLDMEIDNFFPALEKIDDEIEKIEEIVTVKPHPSQLTSILKLKREVIHIKKVAFQQREKIGFLTKNEYKFISKKAIPYFRDVYDHAIRVSDSIDNHREGVGNAFDAYMSAISNNMNQVMKVLSIIATITLPLTVISGIYGTNFAVLPGQNEPYGFWYMVAFMLILAGGMVFLFKRRNWL